MCQMRKDIILIKYLFTSFFEHNEYGVMAIDLFSMNIRPPHNFGHNIWNCNYYYHSPFLFSLSHLLFVDPRKCMPNCNFHHLLGIQYPDMNCQYSCKVMSRMECSGPSRGEGKGGEFEENEPFLGMKMFN